MTQPRGKRIMHQGYAKALRLIFNSDMTCADIMEALSINRASARKLCNGFHDKGLIHIASWIPGSGHLVTAAYAFGPGEDAPHPGRGARKRRHGLLPLELRTFCNGVLALMEDHHHCTSLKEATGWSHGTARSAIRALHALRLIHVCDFFVRAHKGLGPALYTWGPDKPDKRRRPPKTMQENWARHSAQRTLLRRQSNLLRAMTVGVNARAAFPEAIA